MLIVDKESVVKHELAPELAEVITKLARVSPLTRMSWYGVTAVAKSRYEVWFEDHRVKCRHEPANMTERCGRLWIEEQSGGNILFKIASPNIKNEKYGEYNSKYHTKFTRTPDKLYEAAREYLRPLPWHTVLALAAPKGASQHRQWIERGEAEYHSKLRDVSNIHGTIPYLVLDALISERAMNSKFCSPLLNNLTSDDLVSEYKTHMERSKIKNYSSVVFMQPELPDNALADMAVVYAESLRTYSELRAEDVKFSSKENFSSARQEQIAMLNMIEPGLHLPFVGYRPYNHIYYLY